MKDNDFCEIHNAQIAAFNDALYMVDVDNIKVFDQASVNSQIQAPYLLIEAIDMKIDQDKKGSAGLIWVNVNYQAHCILTRSTKNVALECINFAALVLKTVNKNKWGLPHVGEPEELAAFPGRYSAEPSGFDSWIVSWWQRVAIGGNWDLPAPAPENILISEAPNIGTDHKNDYEVLEDGFTNITTP